jgi:ferric-dicitrate binding protein FerR (iron transport regulator)
MGDDSIGEEKNALDAWKKEAEDNIKALQDMQKIASLSNTLGGYEDFNADQAWESFSAQLEKEKTSDPPNAKKTSIFSIKYLSRIAAILIVVFGSTFLINQWIKPASVIDETPSYFAETETLNFGLKDGTSVTLDKNSNLKVIKERNVSLLGRAHFEVERDEANQFSIDVPIGRIVVLGTEFTIDADDKSTEVYVQEGTVRYELQDRTWTLVAGDLVKVRNNEVTVLKGRNDNYDSWKNQRLIFRDNNMVEVIEALSRHFKKEIIIENKKDFSKCNVMDIFTNSSLNDILNGLSKTHGLKYELKGNKVFIVSAKC